MYGDTKHLNTLFSFVSFMRESWEKMQVPIFGVAGILVIFVVVAVALGAAVHWPADDPTGYTAMFAIPELSGERCSLDHYDPVCCNDGITYNNLCLCRAAGALPEYQGICR